ncbi:MAG: glutamate-1-semialdehyde 2,1-aminomutase, partial [Chloroflexota bacterium]
DADGNSYIDYVLSWGPLILGHAHPQVVAALKRAVGRGTSFGAPTELETEMARLIASAMPSIERLRFVTSGTEATMSALRLARAFTKRDKIVKFAGCYHGHADGLLVQAGSGLATLGLPASPGVPASYVQQTLVLPYNDLEAATTLFAQKGREIAAVIVEPIAANMGVVLPRPGFLEGLRRLTKEHGALLIFDEVITGFRVAYGGAQGTYSIKPDLTCLGKVIGGGLPVGAYGGRGEIMDMVAPAGPVYQAGTLSGNPLAMTAGIETLKALSQPEVYEDLAQKTATLAKGMEKIAREADVPLAVAQVPALLTPFFSSQPVTDYETALKSDTKAYGQFFWRMLEGGIYLPPSQFEAMFLSVAHSPEDIAATLEAARKALIK